MHIIKPDKLRNLYTWAGKRTAKDVKLCPPTPTAKKAESAVGFQLAPPMAAPNRENTEISRAKSTVVISSVIAPCTCRFNELGKQMDILGSRVVLFQSRRNLKGATLIGRSLRTPMNLDKAGFGKVSSVHLTIPWKFCQEGSIFKYFLAPYGFTLKSLQTLAFRNIILRFLLMGGGPWVLGYHPYQIFPWVLHLWAYGYPR
eukprot:Gb_11010 [translate_table: standard]